MEKKININGFEVPEPLSEINDGTVVYFPCFLSTWRNADKHIPVFSLVFNEITHGVMRKYGVLHSSWEAANIHAEALLSFTKNTR